MNWRKTTTSPLTIHTPPNSSQLLLEALIWDEISFTLNKANFFNSLVGSSLQGHFRLVQNLLIIVSWSCHERNNHPN